MKLAKFTLMGIAIVIGAILSMILISAVICLFVWSFLWGFENYGNVGVISIAVSWIIITGFILGVFIQRMRY